MRKIFLFIAMAALFSSCSRKLAPVLSESIREVTKTVTIFRDTTIYIHVPGDTVFKAVPVQKDLRGILFSKVNVLSTSLAKSKAWVEDGILKHELIQNDSSVAVLIKNAIKESATVTDKEQVVYKTITENIITGWQWFQIWAGRILLPAFFLLGFIVFINKKPGL